MTRMTAAVLCAALPVALASSVHALPPILDRVPEDAIVVVTVPSVEKLDKDVQAFSAAAKLPVPAMMGVQQFLTMQGLDQVIDSTKPSALFITEWADVEEEPPFVALVPVKDYQGMVNMLEQEQDGMHAMDLGGEKIFSRNLEGGYAAIGPAPAPVRAYAGDAGQAGTHQARLGQIGERIVDASDLAIVINAQAAQPLIEQALQTVKEDMAMQGMPVGAMPESPAIDWLKQAILRDADVYVSGVSASAKGASLDVALRFKPDSYMANAVAEGGDAGALLSRLPRQPYLFTFAMDLASPGLRTFFTDLADQAKEDAGMMPNMAMDQLDKISGQAFMLGGPVALMAPGGLFANALGFVATDDSAGYISAVQEAMSAMDGQMVQGFTYETAWEANATTVGDVSAHAWSLRMADDGTNPMAMQAQMLFGPQGLTGYIAPTKGGVVQTYAKNTMLLTAALEAAKGAQEGVTADEMTKRVGQQLPDERIVEGYLGVNQVMQMVAPFIAMQTGTQPKLPGELPPIGFAVSAGDGAAQARLFIPAPVIEAGAAIGMSLQGPDNFEEEEGGESGQPGF